VLGLLTAMGGLLGAIGDNGARTATGWPRLWTGLTRPGYVADTGAVR
jgi:hypothetical protein